MTRGWRDVYLAALLVLASPGSPARARAPWRFPESPAARLDDKVRFVDSSGGSVDLDKNRISDEPADASRQYCVCSSRDACEATRLQQAVCRDGGRLCCYTAPAPAHHAGRSAGQRPSLAAGHDTHDGLFSPTRDVRPGPAHGHRQRVDTRPNKFYITYIEDYPGVVEAVHPATGPAPYTYISPYEPTFSVKSQKYNKHRYFLAGPDELGGGTGSGVFDGGRGARGEPGLAGHTGILTGPGGPTGSIGPNYPYSRPGTTGVSEVLVGPGGSTGVVGPGRPDHLQQYPDVLVGPDGPAGIIGPGKPYRRPDTSTVLAGPGGPTGFIGPDGRYGRPQSPDVLIGPGGPTGIVGPENLNEHKQHSDVLVGPGGPSGVLGPDPNGQYGRPQSPGASVLVGPGGPTGVVGPQNVNKPKQHIDVLVGPGGPTGLIGPGRPYGRQGHAASGILIGPGGATGNIGPYYVRRVNRERRAGEV